MIRELKRIRKKRVIGKLTLKEYRLKLRKILGKCKTCGFPIHSWEHGKSKRLNGLGRYA